MVLYAVLPSTVHEIVRSWFYVPEFMSILPFWFMVACDAPYVKDHVPFMN